SVSGLALLSGTLIAAEKPAPPASASRYPARPMLFDRAVRDPQGLALDDGTRRRSWAELADRTTRLANSLRDQNRPRPGQHLACLLDNRAEGIEIVVGAMLAGAWITPVNWHLTADEIAYVARDSSARLLFVDDAHAAVAAAVDARLVRVGAELDAALAT